MAYADFETEVLGIVATATGTTPANDDGNPQTLFTSVESARVSIVEYMKDGLEGNRGRPAPPYVAVLLGEMRPYDGAGSSYFPQCARLSVAIIDAMESDATQSSVHTLANAVRVAFDPKSAAYSTFAPIDAGSVDSSATNSVFRALAEESKVQIVAAVVRWDTGLLLLEDTDA